jgi:aquaporin Z
MNKYLTEFIGTMFFVAAVGLAGGEHAVLIIASALMVMIYAGGHVSGAHYNPAVTLAVWMRGKIEMKDAIAYWIAQFAGAVLAGLLVNYLKGTPEGDGMEITETTKGIICELLGTFALAYVVLNVATAKGTNGNSFYGLAIGFTVFAMGSIFGQYTGGALNPAVAIGAWVMKLFAIGTIWVYFVGCLAGAALAAIIFSFINPNDK